MTAVVQRVISAGVISEGETLADMGGGLLVLLGVACGDTEKEARYLADRCAGLRIFADDKGKMNLSLRDTGGGITVVPNFTLYGDCKSRRPGFTAAAPPTEAERLFEYFKSELKGLLPPERVHTGRFGAHMQVSLVNNGPITLILDTDKLMK